MDNTGYQAVFTPFNQAQWAWIIGIYVSEDDYLGAFHQNQKLNILFALAIAIIASLLRMPLARSLSKLITQLGKLDLQE